MLFIADSIVCGTAVCGPDVTSTACMLVATAVIMKVTPAAHSNGCLYQNAVLSTPTKLCYAARNEADVQVNRLRCCAISQLSPSLQVCRLRNWCDQLLSSWSTLSQKGCKAHATAWLTPGKQYLSTTTCVNLRHPFGNFKS